jgi:hypothetical protein
MTSTILLHVVIFSIEIWSHFQQDATPWQQIITGEGHLVGSDATAF